MVCPACGAVTERRDPERPSPTPWPPRALLGGPLAKGFGIAAPFWFAAASVAALADARENADPSA